MGRWPRRAATITEPPPVIDYDALYRRTADTVYRICLAVLHDPDAAADATMDVFRKLISNPPTRHHDNLDGWLRTSARTTAIDHLRHLRRDLPFDEALGLSDPSPTPEEVVLDDDLRRTFRDRFGVLTPDQRQVIELRLEGLSGDEIARLLARKRNWVDTTAFRAIERLRDDLTANAAGKEDGR
ncbi:MAG TPA: sigma-70 family RNA polymerase sigma factor [Thermomicrobiales bacterium]|jgi:RNA polymerase sigma-70 factor (ECF subfamily)